ncbi:MULTISPECIES: DUF2612 domain-containing protein [unclassified Caballeronia]|uniref:DUF2612 domain-containing protein n=1 Tax=unclassified Caballeronia TaxID=2646786 RepID=UPI002027ACD8|nr:MULTISPECIES: DUF2612 domain-containing protein [unclassified Caballeronia]
MADVTDYTGLVTSEHADKPNFMAMVGGVAQAFVDIQNQLAATPSSFDLDSAVGVQLDAVGLWVGVTRTVNTPLTGVYFSLDTSGLGFDQGVWQGPFDPTTGVVSLDDETYRLLIRAKIGANSWDGTLGTSAAILNSIFDSSTYVFLQDNGDMSITYGIAGEVPSAIFLALLRGGYIPLKPEAVHIDGYFVTSNPGGPLFGFDVENNLISGFDVGAWGVAA